MEGAQVPPLTRELECPRGSEMALRAAKTWRSLKRFRDFSSDSYSAKIYILCTEKQTKSWDLHQVNYHTGNIHISYLTARLKRCPGDFSSGPWLRSCACTAGSIGGPVVKNPLSNAGDTGLIPGPGRSHILWWEALILQLEKGLHRKEDPARPRLK